MFSLSSPIHELYGVSDIYEKRLNKLNINTIEELFTHFPFRYEDYRLISNIESLQIGEKITIHGTVSKSSTIRTRLRKTIIVITLRDNTGMVDLVFFNQPYLEKAFKEGVSYSVSGIVGEWQKKKAFIGPDYEEIKENKKLIHTGRLVPIYPETYGISSKWLRNKIAFCLEHCDFLLKETLDEKIIKENGLIDYKKAINRVHFPESEEEIEKARERLAFEELFNIQVAALSRKKRNTERLVSNKFKIQEYKNKLQGFMDNLAFTLTIDQRKAVGEILTDIAKEIPMNRLLQGEVGSGKTVVATIAMYMAYLNGYQSILMAPTQILAMQHYITVKKMLESLGVEIKYQIPARRCYASSVAGGSNIKKGDFKIKNNEKIDIYIGTHALLNKNIPYNKVGLVIIDEQQRFGVEQRGELIAKGINPHVLTMTATPIPRTIALTVYGDIDMSIIKTMPYGRLPIKTWVVPNEKREGAYGWIKTRLRQDYGGQAQLFIICPLIEESETLTTVKSAKKEFLAIQNIFKDLRVGLLHGRMKTEEKDEVLQNFKNKKLDILVTTPVVEVGIDIPGATIMVIEAAERFGLAQLHQLRGRVGRNNQQAYCLLFTEQSDPKIYKRLKYMESNNNGLDLAEIDLKLRGPGEIYGVKQHGIPDLKIATFSDLGLINMARKAAEKAIENSLLKNSPKKYIISSYDTLT